MAWNEPGGKKPNNPWKNDKNQGPPDLDDLLKKIFGGIGKGGGSGGAGLSSGMIGAIFLVLVGLYLFSGLYTVEQAERAVVLTFGEFTREETAGLQWHLPLAQEVLKVNVEEVQKYDHEALMITNDQNIVEVSLDVQFRVNNARDFFLAVEDPINSLQHATSSALRHVVGGEVLDSVITDGREKVAIDVRVRLQQYLDSYKSGLDVVKVSIENTQPPVEVKEAFDDVIKAKEDRDRFINEAEAYANQIIPEARGQRQRQLEEANAYKGEVIAEAEGDTQRFAQILAEYKIAPDVTRSRLYLETMESIYGANPKVMVDVDQGGSLMYLPLEKLMSAQGTSGEINTDVIRPSRAVNRDLRPLDDKTSSTQSRVTREGR